MLLDGLFMHGMGNWLAVAEFMGSRTKQDVRAHYFKYWIESKIWPLPVSMHSVEYSGYLRI
jgi:transcriptional adapter 2-alpha